MVEWWWLLIVFFPTSIGVGLIMALFRGRYIQDLQDTNRRLSRRLMESREQDYDERVGGD